MELTPFEAFMKLVRMALELHTFGFGPSAKKMAECARSFRSEITLEMSEEEETEDDKMSVGKFEEVFGW